MKSSMKLERPARRGVVGVRDAARAVRPVHHLVVADDGLVDPAQHGVSAGRSRIHAIRRFCGGPRAPLRIGQCPTDRRIGPPDVRQARQRNATQVGERSVASCSVSYRDEGFDVLRLWTVAGCAVPGARLRCGADLHAGEVVGLQVRRDDPRRQDRHDIAAGRDHLDQQVGG